MIFRSRRRIALIALVVLVCLAVLFGAAGYLVVPGLVKSGIEEQLAGQIGRSVTVGRIAVHPYRLGVTLSDLRVMESDGAAPMLAVSQIDAGISVMSLLRMAPVVNHLRITAPALHVARDAPQHFNFSDILERIAARPKSGAAPQFSINNIEVTGGSVVFDDAPTHSQHRIEQMALSLPSVSNIRHDVDLFVDPALSARIDGSPIELKARTKPFANSLDTALELQITGLDVARYIGFVPVAIKARVESGVLSGVLEVAFSKHGDAPQQLALAGHLALDNLGVAYPDGSKAMRAAHLAIVIRNVDPFRASADIESVDVEQAELYATRSPAGRIDLLELFAAASADSSPAGAAPQVVRVADATPAPATVAPELGAGALRLGRLKVGAGIVHWRDLLPGKPFDATMSGIACELSGLATSGAEPARLHLEFSPAAEATVVAEGSVAFALHQAALHVALHDVALVPFAPLVAERLRARLEDGVVNAQSDVALDWSGAQAQVRLAHLSSTLDHLRVRRTEERTPIIALEHIALDGGSFDLAGQSVHLDAFTVHGLAANVVRDSAGVLNLMALVAGAAARADNRPAAVTPAGRAGTQDAAARGAGAAGPLAIDIEALQFDEGAFNYSDASLPDKTAVKLDRVSISAQHIRLAPGAHIPFKLAASANHKGRLEITGEVVPTPFAITAQISAHQFPLAALQSYASQRLNVTVASADLTLHGRLRASLGETVQYHFAGGLALTDFSALDRITGADFLTWKSLDIASVAVDTRAAGTPPLVQLGDVVLSDFYSRLIVYPDARLNLQDVMSSAAAPAPKSVTTAAPEPVSAAAPAAAPSPAPVAAPGATSRPLQAPGQASAAVDPALPLIRLKSIALRNGAINFTDNFVKPNYTTAISALTGSVSSVASDSTAPADIALKGSLEGNGDLDVSGKINPLARPLYLDLTASATNIELTRMSAYSIKYAGYNIEKGKLSMKVQYHIENKLLTAQNHLFLDQLTFGERVENTTATKLPVLLAVSLLKNSRGEIDVNLPVSGSLSDPEFSMGGVIVRVLLNLLEKALVSPFALLSSLAPGGGSDDLGFVEFAPGEATLTGAAAAKLDTLATLLADRPALQLDIIGRADRGADSGQARNARLAARVKGEKYKELLAAGDAPAFDAIVITAEEYPRYLEALYKDMDFDKPKNIVGLTKSLPVPEMEALIRANMPIDDDDLRNLAYRRASAVSAALAKGAKLAPTRIFLVAPKLDDESGPVKGNPSRVDFALR